MSLHDQDKLDALRRRLYERGQQQQPITRHGLSDIKEPVREEWQKPPEPHAPAPTPIVTTPTPAPEQPPTAPEPAADPVPVPETVPMAPRKRTKKYRLRLLIAGGIFFLVAMVTAAILLWVNDGNIDGDNIVIDVSGPFAVGGGEEVPINVTVTNQNPVPIESAVLIVDYPFGTQSATEAGKEIFTERFTLDTIESGEVVNIPVRALVFGEENADKEVKVSLDYRVEGSNSTFFVAADPLRFKISSSPIVLQVEGVNKISSGQEYGATLTIISNSPNTLTDVLVSAEYPQDFDFSQSNPPAVSGTNVWLLEELTPGARETIVLSGLVVGEENAERAFKYSVGVPSERDPFTLASTFTTFTESITIEQPFLDLDVQINNSSNETVTVSKRDSSNVIVSFTNTLSDSLFDTVVTVALSGNALTEEDVQVSSGFYDSTTNTITFDKNSASDLGEIVPGDTEQVSFRIANDGQTVETPQINMTIDVTARRVFDNRTSEELLGTASRVVKVESVPDLFSAVEYNNSVFPNFGPVPPVAEKTTTYTIYLRADNTTNEISDAVVTAKLPSYVTWRDVVTSGDPITFNENNRTVTWEIGSIDPNTSIDAAFQIELTPSKTQIENTPVLVEEQQFKATDTFTGSVIRASAPIISTSLPAEAGFGDNSGRVLPE